MRYGILLLAVLATSACTQELAVKHVSAEQGSISRNGYAYVAVPPDGQYGKTKYHGTGQMTAQAVAGAFAKYLEKTDTGLRVEDTDDSLARARNLGADYLIAPLILHWEDRATEWSGRPDRIEVKITVVDVESERSLASGVVSGKSSWWTFGGDRPEDMLTEPINEFVSGLF